MNSVYKFWLSMTMLCLTVPVFGGGHDDSEQLQALLSPVQSLQGKFTQTLSDVDNNLIQETEGEFAVQRPGKFYWHTAAPFEQILVTDEKTLWLFDPDLEQVTIRANDQRLQQTPLLILSGDTDVLSENFLVEQLSDQLFQLTPRERDGPFQTLTLQFEDKQLKSVALVDGLGQTTLLSFAELVPNPELAASQFVFVIPTGADVIRDE